MSRFTAPDLSRLPPPEIIETVSFEQGLLARLADLKARAAAAGVDYDTGALRTDPLRIDQEVSMDREIMMRARINDAIRALLLPTSFGDNIDQIANTYYRGLARLPILWDDNGKPVAFEDDQTFKERIQIAPEGFAAAGPAGAYEFHALEVEGRRAVSRAAVYSHEDGARLRDGTPLVPAEVLVVVVPSIGWLEREAWTTDMSLGPLVYRELSSSALRPCGDRLIVYVAERAVFNVNAVLRFSAGADVQIALAEAERQVRAYAAEQRRSGGVIERLGLGDALRQGGVSSINLIAPAADFDPGSLFAPDLGELTISHSFEEGGFR
ncbi:MAG: baseplate J/gp47 family protein [Rhizobiales bacterium]|nr:baseplate J/gp47 family protein [Hyphomicrobiales bacterium]